MGAEVANYHYTAAAINNHLHMEQDYHHINDDITDSHLVDFVRHALKSVTEDNIDNYSELISLLHYKKRRTAKDVALLVTSLKALSGAVSYIDAEHHDALFGGSWINGSWI